jgi:hypothetical protein
MPIDNNNLALAGVVAIAADNIDPDENQLQYDSNHSQQADDGSNAVGNDQAQNGSAVDNDESNLNSPGGVSDPFDSNIVTGGGNAAQKGGEIDTNDSDGSNYADRGGELNQGQVATRGGEIDTNDSDGSNYADRGGELNQGQVATRGGEINTDASHSDGSNYADRGGELNQGQVATRGGEIDASHSDGSNYADRGGELYQNSTVATRGGELYQDSNVATRGGELHQNSDNDDHSGFQRDFDHLQDNNPAPFTGIFAPDALQQSLTGGGNIINGDQMEYLNSTGDANGTYNFGNAGGGGAGGGGEDSASSGDASCYNPCEATAVALQGDTYNPHSSDGAASGDGGDGAFGFQMWSGDATASSGNAGGNTIDGDGNSGGGSTASATSHLEAFNNNVIVGANSQSQSFSPLVGDHVSDSL